MSTKIPNGFRLAEGADTSSFIRMVRAVLDPLRDQEDLKLLAGTVATDIDRAWTRAEQTPVGIMVTVGTHWNNEQRAMSTRDWDHDPNRFEFSYGTDPGTGRLMGIVYAENKTLLDAFQAMNEVEEYGYWNNTDSYPDGVTRADWLLRKAAWDRMLPGMGRPSDTMETWVLRDTPTIREELQDPRLLLSHMPSLSARAHNIGADAYSSYLVQTHGIDVWDAVRHTGFGRSAKLEMVVDTVAAHLPEITVDLLVQGSSGTAIGPGYADALKAACDTLYELDKEKLADRS